jgi:hypothetical protein
VGLDLTRLKFGRHDGNVEESASGGVASGGGGGDRVAPSRAADIGRLADPPIPVPDRSGHDDRFGSLGMSNDPRWGADRPGIDMARTNELLQQLVDEVRRGRSGALPPGARPVIAER